MSKRVKACCVPGCTNKQAIGHSISRNEDVCRIWLPRINNPKLMRADTVLSSHRICDIHFEQICRNPNGREHKENVLCAPSAKFCDIFKSFSDKIFEGLPQLINSLGIKKQIFRLEDLTDTSSIFCSDNKDYGKDQQYKDYDVVMNMAYVKYRESCKKDNGNH